MGKLKDYFGSLSERFRSGALRFSAATGCSGLLFFALAAGIYGNNNVEDWGWRFTAALSFAMVAAVTARLWNERRGKNSPVLPWVCGLGLALVWVIVLVAWEDVTYAALAYGGLMCAMVCACLWLLYGPENRDTLFAFAVKSAVFAGFAALVAMLGLFVCVAAVDALLWDGFAQWELFCLIAAFCFDILAVNLFLGCLPRRGEALAVPKVYYTVTAGVMLPLFLLLMAILYGYVAKIILTWSMPVGRMNWYASSALAAFVFLWLSLAGHGGNLVKKFMARGWLLLLPVTAVQIVGIAIRLSAYGLTSVRYVSLACLAVGLFCLYIAGRKSHPAKLFAAAGAVALLITITPLNLADVPVWSQSIRLKALLTENAMYTDGAIVHGEAELDEDTRDAIYSAYAYLNRYSPTPNGHTFAKKATEGTFVDLYGFDPYGDGAVDNRWSDYFYTRDRSMSVAGYTRLYVAQDYFHTTREKDYVLKLPTGEDGETLSVSLASLAQGLAERHGRRLDNSLQLPAEELSLSLPGGGTAYFTSLDLVYRDGALYEIEAGYTYLLLP